MECLEQDIKTMNRSFNFFLSYVNPWRLGIN